jgi:hypothetical protein
MADITNDIFNICSQPLRLYSDVLPSAKRRKVVPKEDFATDKPVVPPYEAQEGYQR